MLPLPMLIGIVLIVGNVILAQHPLQVGVSLVLGLCPHRGQ